MLRYQSYLKGNNVYSECVGKATLCEGGSCSEQAVYSIRGDRFDDELKHVCKAHLEVKDYVLQGRCDNCTRSSVEPWLCLVFVKGQSTLFKLCKKCHREKRRVKNVQ